jgi:hypothetical protein
MDKLYFLVSMMFILDTGPQISISIGNTIAEISAKSPKSLSQFSRPSSGSWSRSMRVFLPSQSHFDAVMLDRQCWCAKQFRLRTSRWILTCTYAGRQTLLALPAMAHRCITIWKSLRTALGTRRHCYNLVVTVMFLHRCCRCSSVVAMAAQVVGLNPHSICVVQEPGSDLGLSSNIPLDKGRSSTFVHTMRQ